MLQLCTLTKKSFIKGGKKCFVKIAERKFQTEQHSAAHAEQQQMEMLQKSSQQ
jgi:hypothetical protein